MYYENGFWFEENEGKIKEITNYSNNKKNGTAKTFYENGILSNSGNYIEDEKDGNWYYHNIDSKLEKTETYQNGKLIETKKISQSEKISI